MQFSDFETSMPQLMNGNQGTGPTPETVGGMVMLYNSANTVLRMRVKKYDDRITRPHISRYYDYNMANHPDAAIKGDFEIDARGASALVERDVQNQATLTLAQITSNPRYSPHMKEREELKAILKAFRFDPESMMKTDGEVKSAQQNQQPPEDPRVTAANIAAQTKQAEIADRKEQRQLDAQVADRDAQLQEMDMALRAEGKRSDSEQNRLKMQLDREVTIAKMNQDNMENEAERQSRERLGTMQLESKHQLFNAEAALRVRTGEGI
jgi:hypothetical protein